MHLITILAYACLFWYAEEPPGGSLFGPNDRIGTLLVVLLHPLVLGLASWHLGRRARRMLAAQPDTPQLAQLAYHRTTLVLRTAALIGFAGTLFLTRWPTWFAFGRITPALQIVGDLIVLSPFFGSALLIWLGAYPVDRAVREQAAAWGPPGLEETEKPWTLRKFLEFNVRHQLLIVAVPLTLILLAADLARGYEEPLARWTGSLWTGDLMVAVVAAGVFVFAPWMLCRIWHTIPLERGPVRERLEAISRRIGLRYRDILVWHSDGMMINAAVMGVIPPVRYVLLSDGLLATMAPSQIEAVFGHEAGHVRHRHIQHFLVFALVGWLLVAAIMELLARFAVDWEASGTTAATVVQTVGAAATIGYWAIGFGWLSRRFEREADLFGARCVTPDGESCALPCGVHGDRPGGSAVTAPSAEPGMESASDRAPVSREAPATSVRDGSDDRVCATAAAIFASALDRVALLNGIPHEERSWRHSSIGSRIRFLVSLAGDPNRARRFQRLVRRVRAVMVAVALIGCVITVYYWRDVTEPAVFRLP